MTAARPSRPSTRRRPARWTRGGSGRRCRTSPASRTPRPGASSMPTTGTAAVPSTTPSSRTSRPRAASRRRGGRRRPLPRPPAGGATRPPGGGATTTTTTTTPWPSSRSRFSARCGAGPTRRSSRIGTGCRASSPATTRRATGRWIRKSYGSWWKRPSTKWRGMTWTRSSRCWTRTATAASRTRSLRTSSGARPANPRGWTSCARPCGSSSARSAAGAASRGRRPSTCAWCSARAMRRRRGGWNGRSLTKLSRARP